jgi:hypothetical protein
MQLIVTRQLPAIDCPDYAVDILAPPQRVKYPAIRHFPNDSPLIPDTGKYRYCFADSVPPYVSHHTRSGVVSLYVQGLLEPSGVAKRCARSAVTRHEVHLFHLSH